MASDPIIYGLLHALLLATIASSAAIALVLILRKPLRHRLGATAAYAVWLLVPLAAASALLPTPVITEVSPVVMHVVPKAQTAANRVVAAPTIQLAYIAPWLFAVWLAGLAMALALFVRQQRRFVRGLGQLSSIDADTAIAQTIAGCPALVGAWRPRIVLPADFEQRYNGDERVLILAHERSHRARGDAQINALAALLRGVFWFNPLIHFAASRLRFDQELACDAVVISRFPHARRSYADAMLKTQLADIGLPIGCYWQAAHPLKERIAMLKQPLPGRVRGILGIALAATLIVGGTYVAWAAQPARRVASALNGASGIRSNFKLTIDGEVAIDTHDSVDSRKHSSWKGEELSMDRAVVTDAILHSHYQSGETYTMRATKGDQQWLVETTISANTVDTARVDAKISHNGKIVSKPSVIVRYGQPGAIQISEDHGKNDGGFKGVRLDFTLAPFTAGDSTKNESGSAKPVEATVKTAASYKRLKAIDYPAAEARAGIGGVVLVRAHINAQGRVESTAIESGPGNTTHLAKLTQAALDGVKGWSFEPATRNGKAVASDAIVPIKFVTKANANQNVVGGTLDAIEIRPAKS